MGRDTSWRYKRHANVDLWAREDIIMIWEGKKKLRAKFRTELRATIKSKDSTIQCYRRLESRANQQRKFAEEVYTDFSKRVRGIARHSMINHPEAVNCEREPRKYHIRKRLDAVLAVPNNRASTISFKDMVIEDLFLIGVMERTDLTNDCIHFFANIKSPHGALKQVAYMISRSGLPSLNDKDVSLFLNREMIPLMSQAIVKAAKGM